MGFNVPSFRCERVLLSWEEVRRTEGSHGFQAPVPAVSGTTLPTWALQWEDPPCQAAKWCCIPSSYRFILALFVLL